MSAAARFVTVTLLWAAGLAVLIVVAGAIGDEPLTVSRSLRWLPSVLGLAMYPAGVSVGSVLIGESPPWRLLLHVVTAAVAVGVIVLVLSIGAPNGDSTRGLAALLRRHAIPARAGRRATTPHGRSSPHSSRRRAHCSSPPSGCRWVSGRSTEYHVPYIVHSTGVSASA